VTLLKNYRISRKAAKDAKNFFITMGLLLVFPDWRKINGHGDRGIFTSRDI